MNKAPLSIKSILIITISILTLLIASLAVKETYIEGKRMLKIQSLQDATIISDEFFNVIEKFSIIRDITSLMLYAPEQETINKLRPQLIRSRDQANEILNSVLLSLEKYNEFAITKKIADIKSRYQKLKDARIKLDKAIALPMSNNKRADAEAWFGEATELIMQIQDLWMEFIKHYSDIDPAVTLHMRFKHFLAVIMEYTGRSRAVIGRLIVEEATATPAEQANLIKWQGAIELGWGRINSFANQVGLYPSITPYVDDAVSHYTIVYEMVRDMFYVPGVKHSAPYPMSVELWLEVSSQATDSIYELKNASFIQAHNYVKMLKHKAKFAIALNIMFLVISIILCLYSFWIISFRVLYPINYMVEALLDVTKGKQVVLDPTMVLKNDEIGKLAQVLLVLQRSNERYRALIEASSQVIWTWEPGDTGDMVAFKEWWHNATGQAEEEILPLGWLKFVHPVDRDNARKAWHEASTTGKEFHLEYRIFDRVGTYKYLYIRGVPIKNPDGSLREFVGALNDITSRKEADIKLKLYMQDLERSNKELDDFAYIASHDLKEPLRGIHNHSRFLLEDNKDKLDEDSVKRIGRLIYLSQRMERLVNDLLYFSRLGRQNLAIIETDINEVIRDIENTLDVFMKENNGKIIIPKPLPIITCDKTRVTEIFRNLITNAIKYNDKDTKLIEIGFLENCVASDNAALNNVFYVKDNGNGIVKEFYTEVFRIFKRLQNHKDKNTEGTGVGLTFVKKIIERHGGKIWLESEPGKGTVFYFTLKEQKYDAANA